MALIVYIHPEDRRYVPAASIHLRSKSLDSELVETAEELLLKRELRLAVEVFLKAEFAGANPDRCSAGRWMAHMMLGNFSAAWYESDAIRQRGGEDPHSLWKGEDILGRKLIVRCLHGFGDSVQFLRYAPLLARMASTVIWEVPPAMVKIAPYFHGVEEVITWEDKATPTPAWNVQIEIMELPYFFRTQIAELPVARNYLRLPAEITRPIAAQMGKRKAPRIGVVWAAGEWNLSRSLAITSLLPVLMNPDFEFWNLQGGSNRNEWRALPLCTNLREVEACDSGILAMAGVISQLDLVITVDTLAAHLAGALGVPAWVMLQYSADWRWMIDRNDSPWYPSLRLFRQPVPGDWSSVVCAVNESLREWERTVVWKHTA